MRYLRLAGLPNGPKLHRTPPRPNPRRPHATSTPQLRAPAHSLTTFPIQLPYQASTNVLCVKHPGHDIHRCMIRAFRLQPNLSLPTVTPAPATWPALRRSSSCHLYAIGSFELRGPPIDFSAQILAIGFLLVILSSALFKSYLTLLVVATYVLAPVPNWICSKAQQNDDFMDSGSNSIVELGRFLTGFLVVMGVGRFAGLAY